MLLFNLHKFDFRPKPQKQHCEDVIVYCKSDKTVENSPLKDRREFRITTIFSKMEFFFMG